MKSPTVREVAGLLTILFALDTVNAANILCLLGAATASHQLWANALLKGLEADGHQLTVVGTQARGPPPLSKESTFIDLEHIYKYVNAEELGKDPYEPLNSFNMMLLRYKRQMQMCKGILESEGYSSALELSEDKQVFDLIIYDATYAYDCLLNLAHLFEDVPIVAVSPSKVTADILQVARSNVGHLAASVPYFTTYYAQNITYFGRWYNRFLYSSSHFFKKYVVARVQEDLLTKRNAKVPATTDLLRDRIKLVLVNSHPAIDFPLPLPPNVIEVGGLHIEESEPLPQDLLEVMEASKKKVIYISLGSKEHTDLLGSSRISDIVSVIKRLPDYTFLWRLDNKSLVKNPPKNLHIRSWFPQNDILASAYVNAFITNGGHLSIQEATYHGVPMVIFPLEMDEFNNAYRASIRGSSLKLDFHNFNENSLYDALSMVLESSQYKERAEFWKLAFRNRLQTPLNIALWWIDAIIATPNGFDHLASNPQYELSYIVTHSWDVFFLLVVAVTAFIANCVIVVRQFLNISKTRKKLLHNSHVEKIKTSKAKKIKKNN